MVFSCHSVLCALCRNSTTNNGFIEIVFWWKFVQVYSSLLGSSLRPLWFICYINSWVLCNLWMYSWWRYAPGLPLPRDRFLWITFLQNVRSPGFRLGPHFVSVLGKDVQVSVTQLRLGVRNIENATAWLNRKRVKTFTFLYEYDVFLFVVNVHLEPDPARTLYPFLLIVRGVVTKLRSGIHSNASSTGAIVGRSIKL